MNRPVAASRRRRGSVALEEVMILAVMLPIVVTAVSLAAQAFAMFGDVIAALTGSPFP